VLTEVDLSIVPKPFGWVTVARIYIRKRDWEMDEVEIKVIKPPVRELFLRRCLDLPQNPIS
jgi:hypothetical protein